jgi:signal transduction histidine kinase/CheY-like chemotaxis protein
LNSAANRSGRVLILAPQGRDTQIAASLLAEAGLRSQACRDQIELVRELAGGAGLALIADDVLNDSDLRPLIGFLREQPAWSDLPLIVLTRRGGGPERNPHAARLAELLGNVSFLERPFHPATLLSMVKSALRGRLRQYEARSRIDELAEAEEQLQTALRGGHLGSWILHVRERTLECSDTCLRHFGRGAGAPFSYEALREAICAEDRDRWLASLEYSIESGADYVIEYRVTWPDGSRHWLEARARAVRDTNGEVFRLVGVTLDITARKEADEEREALLSALATERAALADLTRTLEQRVRDSTAELISAVAAREKAQEQLLQSQKMETIGQLTGGVAHDFNNLLTAIMANLDLLGKRVPADPALHKLIESALQGAARGAALTQRMLAFARQQDLKTSAVHLDDLLRGMRDLLVRSIGPTIALSIETEAAMPAAQVDGNQVELAILNLVINARDAMPRGGSVRIEAGSRQDAKRASTSPRVYIRVSDDGEGMDEITRRRCIEPFFSTKPPGKGTGLGLSMVHGLAVQLGGSFEIASELGAGTSVTLWLPVADGAPESEAGETVERAAPRRVRVLLVDDDSLIRLSTVALLEELGHDVVVAESARRALTILAADLRIDCVVTDHAMPEMTGLEFIEVARERYPDLPILLTTGYADLPGEMRVPRLTKPFRLAQLDEAISRLLEGRREPSSQPALLPERVG